LPVVILTTWKVEIRKTVVQGQSFGNPNSKITRAKWTGGMPQAVECLLCKCEALSSNSIPQQPPPQKIDVVAHIYNATYLRGREKEDYGLRPAQAKSLRDPF
jgi:hypothetical protein